VKGRASWSGPLVRTSLSVEFDALAHTIGDRESHTARTTSVRRNVCRSAPRRHREFMGAIVVKRGRSGSPMAPPRTVPYRLRETPRAEIVEGFG